MTQLKWAMNLNRVIKIEKNGYETSQKVIIILSNYENSN